MSANACPRDSSSVRSAPPLKVSLPEVITAAWMAESLLTSSTMVESSSTTFVSMTFIERPGMSQVTSAMPSASTSNRKLTKDIGCSWLPVLRLFASVVIARRRASRRHRHAAHGGCSAPVPRIRGAVTRLDSLDDGRRPHAGADAQRHQRGRKLAAFQLVEHGAEDHGARRAERMAHGDRAAVDIDFGGIEIECLLIAQHDGR